jgi:hypothetical protein
MRAIRTWGSVRGVPGNRYPYRDQRWEATGAPTQEPEYAEAAGAASGGQIVFWPESDKSRGLGRSPNPGSHLPRFWGLSKKTSAGVRYFRD